MVIHVFSPSTLEIHYHSQLKPCFIEDDRNNQKRSSMSPTHVHLLCLLSRLCG